MRVLGDLVARDRRSDRPALRIDARDRTFSYHEFCTTAWKAGHALTHLGVHRGSRVALATDPSPPILQTCVGAASLGARVAFDTSAESRVVVVPADREAEFDAAASRVVVYGDAPASTAATHWEGVVWSENPSVPPAEPDPADPVLDRPADDAPLTHCDFLSRAERIVADAGLDAETSVALRASLADPHAVIAGVVAPLVAGGTVVIPDGGGASADVAVGSDPAPEPRRIDPDTV
ncbi:AMP-binding protein [Haloplanus halobius]|uniref:AMP-binding protein n=1 Tax=Haloplanus halobius TaxID=2934938 RepID=UPI0020101D7C|nr:AMP-binding protein [Haloplanus sp. XH21]